MSRRSEVERRDKMESTRGWTSQASCLNFQNCFAIGAGKACIVGPESWCMPYTHSRR